MSEYTFKVSQIRKQNWTVTVEAESEEAARETVKYGFDDDHGFFYEDTQGLVVVEDDGPIGEYEGLVFED